MSFFRDLFWGLGGVALGDTIDKLTERESSISESQSISSDSDPDGLRGWVEYDDEKRRMKKQEDIIKMANTKREIDAITKLVAERYKKD